MLNAPIALFAQRSAVYLPTVSDNGVRGQALTLGQKNLMTFVWVGG
jgi:hypothetical protein